MQPVQALREQYESELQAQRYTNPLQLLMSDAPLTSGSILTSCPNITENSSNEQIAAQSCSSGPVDAENSSGGPAEALTVHSIRSDSRGLNGDQAAEGTDKQDVCTGTANTHIHQLPYSHSYSYNTLHYPGCGAAMEDLPYLEILCVSDATCNAHQSLAADGGAQVEEENSATKSPRSYEKQGSLITLAWSKPPGEDTDYEAETAGQSQDVESSLKTQVQPRDINSTAEDMQSAETFEERDREDLKRTLFQSDPTGDPDAQSADQHCSTVRQVLCKCKADHRILHYSFMHLIFFRLYSH